MKLSVLVLGRDGGYTVKYNPLPEGVHEGEARRNSSRAGPILEKPVLAQLYWEYIFPYCPSRRLWCGSFENLPGNTLCLEGYIAIIVFSIFHRWLNENV